METGELGVNYDSNQHVEKNSMIFFCYETWYLVLVIYEIIFRKFKISFRKDIHL